MERVEREKARFVATLNAMFERGATNAAAEDEAARKVLASMVKLFIENRIEGVSLRF
jgi:hypothetical protein